MDGDFDNVLLETEENITLVTINRPESMNSLNTKTLNELLKVLRKVGSDEGVKCVILTGSGNKAFVSGADIDELVDKSVEEAIEFSELGHEVLRKLETMSIPSIAAVNGHALGGGNELALACDIRIAAEGAKFGQPEIKLGIVPGFGGTQRLPKEVGSAVAAEMILTGGEIKADEAHEIGLVNEVVPRNRVMERSKELARKIASKSKISIQTSKDLINASIETSLETGLERERKEFGRLFDTKDQKEGMQAFLEGREPHFENR